MSQLNDLLAQLKSNDETDRRYAVEDLGELGDPTALPDLASMLRDPSPAVRETVIDVLVKFDGALVSVCVVEFVDTEDVPLRNAALDVLGQLGHETYAEIHRKLVLNPSTDLKKFGLDIYIRTGHLDGDKHQAILKDIEVLLEHPNENVAGAALEALGQKPGLVDPKRLLTFVGKSVWLEINAIIALERILGRSGLLALEGLDRAKLGAPSRAFLKKLEGMAA